MDQSKTIIPSHNTSESNPSLTMCVIGAIVHSAIKLSYAFLVTDFTKETNTNIEVLRRVLDDPCYHQPSCCSSTTLRKRTKTRTFSLFWQS